MRQCVRGQRHCAPEWGVETGRKFAHGDRGRRLVLPSAHRPVPVGRRRSRHFANHKRPALFKPKGACPMAGQEGCGPTLATAGGEDVYVWNLGKPGVQLDALAPSACLPPLSGGVTALSWTSISNSLAAASSRGTISLFSQGGAPLETMTSKDASGDGERIKCISFASHSLSLCSGGSSTELRIWDCKRKEVVRTYRGHSAAISACAYGDKDMLLASGSSSGDVLVHTTASPSAASEPQRIKTGGAGGYASAVRALKFSPFRRSHVAAAGEEAVVELFDTARSDAPSLVKFTQHTGTVTGLAFSPVNELLLCSAGLDCRALFYDVQAKKLVKSVTCEAP